MGLAKSSIRKVDVESLTLRNMSCNYDYVVTNQTDCSTDMCINMYDRKSKISFKLKNSNYVEGKMFLFTSYGSHFLESTEENRYFAQMKLRDGDKLLGINYQPVECYDHDSVLEMLHYLLYPPVKMPINLMIERYHDCGPKVVEIQISSTDDGWASFEVDKDQDLPITVQVYFSVNFTLNIYHIRAQFSSKVLIQPANVNGFVIPVERELLIQSGKHKEQNVFGYNEYDGKARRRGRRPDKMFFAVFQSFVYKMYITARSETELWLTKGDELPKCHDRKMIQGPSTFIIHKTDDGHLMFESLTFRGSFWVSNEKSKRLEMRKLSRSQLQDNPDSWFTLVPCKAKL